MTQGEPPTPLHAPYPRYPATDRSEEPIRRPGLVGRGAAIGTAVGAGGGGVLGLILGLNAYPPTAWFAVFEIGIPGAIVGSLLGVTAGFIARR
jgi:hypothetical protein